MTRLLASCQTKSWRALQGDSAWLSGSQLSKCSMTDQKSTGLTSRRWQLAIQCCKWSMQQLVWESWWLLETHSSQKQAPFRMLSLSFHWYPASTHPRLCYRCRMWSWYQNSSDHQCAPKISDCFQSLLTYQYSKAKSCLSLLCTAS